MGGDLDLGHLFFHKLADDLSAALEVLALLVHPLVAVGVSGFHGGERQVGGAEHPAAVVSVLDLLLELCIGDDHAGGTQTGHVERLADGGVDHQLVVDLGKLARGGAGTGEAEITVDLIAQQVDVVLDAQLHQLFHLFLGPDTADGVVGVAEDHSLDAVGQLFLQQLPVDGVVVVLVVQRAVHQSVAAVLDGCKERVVHRGKGQDFLALGHHGVQREVNAGDHAVAQQHPVGLGLPAVAAVPPALDGGVNAGQRFGIADHGVVAALLECLHHFRSRCKIGIRDPVGQQAALLAKAVLEIPLNAAGAAAVYHFVEIIHREQILSLLKSSIAKARADRAHSTLSCLAFASLFSYHVL